MDTSARSKNAMESPFLPCPSPHEGISKVFSTWHALQMAVTNQWGGNDSLKKSHQLVCEIHFWFSQPKNFYNLEELEDLLHERLLLSFNTDIEDGSIEKVAEELMIMHEEESLHPSQHLVESCKDCCSNRTVGLRN